MNIALPRHRTGHKSNLPAFLVALSVVAILAAGGIWKSAGSGETATPPSSSASSFHVTHGNPPLLLYVVGSDAQRDLIIDGENQAANERAASNMPNGDYQVLILKVTTPQEERNVSEVVDAWIAAGSMVDLHDVRNLSGID